MLDKAGVHAASALPFALFRKPFESQITAVFQENSQLHRVRDFSESGFILAPFSPGNPPVLIRPDNLLRAAGPPPPENGTTGKAVILQMAEKKGKEAHIQLVKKALEAIGGGSLRKVVLSCATEVSGIASPLDLFPFLLALNPDAFCYLWSHPNTGTWMGATPELFLETDKDEITTMSLAGTRACPPDRSPEWNKKEWDEQGMVTSYIVERLRPLLDQMEVSETKTVRAGSVCHLKNTIRGRMGTAGLRDIIAALHPTPAVCGLPVSAASEFIARNEDYDREFYTGFLGELNSGPEKKSRLYVNLRCMRVGGKHARIYSGGGITVDSDPMAEWQEILDKRNTMFRVLFNSGAKLGDPADPS